MTDLHLIAAKYVLGLLAENNQLVRVATEALVEGSSSKSLAQLAGFLPCEDPEEAERLFEAGLRESGVPIPRVPRAVARVRVEIARDVVAGKCTVRAGASEIVDLYQSCHVHPDQAVRALEDLESKFDPDLHAGGGIRWETAQKIERRMKSVCSKIVRDSNRQDLLLLAARYVLGLHAGRANGGDRAATPPLHVDDLPRVATEALLKGARSESFAELAGSLPASGEARRLFEAGLRESFVGIPTLSDAVARLRYLCASEVSACRSDTRTAAREIVRLYKSYPVRSDPAVSTLESLENRLDPDLYSGRRVPPEAVADIERRMEAICDEIVSDFHVRALNAVGRVSLEVAVASQRIMDDACADMLRSPPVTGERRAPRDHPPETRGTARDRIRRAIDDVYSAFPRQPPKIIRGCPCCAPEARLRALLERPLREVPGSELGWYAFKAMSTIGTVRDFRYFWPRIAELAVADALEVDPEIVFKKLESGGWRSWPPWEKDAVAGLAEALSARFASEVLDDPEEWLCALGQFLTDMRPCLRPLLEPTFAARVNLATIYEDNRERLVSGVLRDAFWSDAKENCAAVAEWLGSKEVADAVAKGTSCVLTHRWPYPDTPVLMGLQSEDLSVADAKHQAEAFATTRSPLEFGALVEEIESELHEPVPGGAVEYRETERRYREYVREFVARLRVLIGAERLP